jgi:hypothetical protein
MYRLFRPGLHAMVPVRAAGVSDSGVTLRANLKRHLQHQVLLLLLVIIRLVLIKLCSHSSHPLSSTLQHFALAGHSRTHSSHTHTVTSQSPLCQRGAERPTAPEMVPGGLGGISTTLTRQ